MLWGARTGAAMPAHACDVCAQRRAHVSTTAAPSRAHVFPVQIGFIDCLSWEARLGIVPIFSNQLLQTGHKLMTQNIAVALDILPEDCLQHIHMLAHHRQMLFGRFILPTAEIIQRLGYRGSECISKHARLRFDYKSSLCQFFYQHISHTTS